VASEVAYRFLKGKEREEMKIRLAHKTAGKVRRKLQTNGDKEMMNVGNYNEIKNIIILKNSRHEVNTLWRI